MSFSAEPSDPRTVRSTSGDLLEAVGQALACLRQGLPQADVEDWARTTLASNGRVVLCGMGKSGLIAQKIAATLASTGCPSFFMHPAEAIHGDLGMITAEDSLLVLSNSGETDEVVRLLPSLLRLGIPLAAITQHRTSTLGQAARWCFTYDLPSGEGCPLGVAPMASTTLQLIWGDLLAAQRMHMAGFTQARFAEFHPGGSLGIKLMLTKELMDNNPPSVGPDAPFAEALSTMTRGRLGMTTVQAGHQLLGVISDGDIRRAVERAQHEGRNPLELQARDIMTPGPVTIPSGMKALEAANLMETRKITFLVVKDADQVVGVLHIHHLLQAKVL